jgi:hypothetical protein
MVGDCEQGSDASDCINFVAFFDQLRDNQYIKEDSATWTLMMMMMMIMTTTIMITIPTECDILCA